MVCGELIEEVSNTSVPLTIRVPFKVYQLIKEACREGFALNPSDFSRKAIIAELGRLGFLRKEKTSQEVS